MEILVLLATGAASGLIAGLVGLAGGIVVVPALTWLYGNAALHDAIVISWFAVLFNSIGAAHKQWRIRSPEQRREMLFSSRHYMLGAVIVTPIVAATLSGAKHLVTPAMVAILQLCLAAVMLYPVKEGQTAPRATHNVMDAFFGGLIGGVSTLIGVGGGTYTIAYFVYAARRPFRDAIATANINGLVVGVLSVAAFLVSLSYSPAMPSASTSPISTTGMVLLIVTGVIFSSLGVRLSRRLPTAVLKKILVAALIVSAVRLLLS